jgi:ABC-2 type transport system permease protein
MKKHLKFISTLIKMKLSHMMVFRLSFFGAFWVDGTLFLIQLLMFQAIYSQVDTIGGWTEGEMVIFIGTFSFINALNMVIFFFGINDLPDKIKTGALDHYITKPVSPLLRLTFENVNLGSVPLVFASIGIIAYGISVCKISFSFLQGVGYGILVLFMTLLWYDTQLILRCIPFFVISATNITRAEELLGLCMKVPGVLFKGAFKVLFYFILPYGIMATIPTQFIMRTISPMGIAYGIFIVALFTILTLGIWRFGLKNYKSASS